MTRHFVATTSADSGMIIDRHAGVRVARWRHKIHDLPNYWDPIPIPWSFFRLSHPSCTSCAVNPHNSDQVFNGFLLNQWKRTLQKETDIACQIAKTFYLATVLNYFSVFGISWNILTVSLPGNHSWRGWVREALDFKKKIPRTLNDLWYYWYKGCGIGNWIIRLW